MADNIVVQSELKVLPVPPGRQVKPSSACLSAPCLPPLLSHVFGLCPRRQREHRAFVRAKARFAGPKAQEHSFVRRNAVTPDILPCIVGGIFGGKCRACLALPEVPASDLSVLIHSRWLPPGPLRHPPSPGVSLFRHFRCYPDRLPALHGPLRHPSPPGVSLFRCFRCYLDPPHPAWLSPASVAARCEPISAFPLLPGPSTCPAWPSAASTSARCEPVPVFPLLPGPSTCLVWLSAVSVAARCEPVPAFPLLPGPSTSPAWPSAASVAARCEPFSENRLTPASCDSDSWSGTMAAGAREQAASCDAFVLSRRLPAPDAPPSRTSPLCFIAKPFPEPSPNHGPVTSWPGLPPRIPSGSVKGAPSRGRSGRGRCDRRGLAVRVGHAHPALRVLQGLPS